MRRPSAARSSATRPLSRVAQAIDAELGALLNPGTTGIQGASIALEISRWQILGAKVSGNDKILTGTAFPIAGDYYQGYRLELDRVFVCHGKGSGAHTQRVAFPEAMAAHLAHADAVGLCEADAPL